MQVSNNMQSSQNFGMALKITKGGKEYLAKQSEEVLNSLVKIGDEMKDYKHWDLFVTEDGYQAIEKNAVLPHIYGKSVSVPADDAINKYRTNSIKIDTYVGAYANKGDKVSYEFDNIAEKEIHDLKEACSKPWTHNAFAEFVRFMERRSAEEAAKQAAEKAKAEKIDGLVNDLVSKFSVDA